MKNVSARVPVTEAEPFLNKLNAAGVSYASWLREKINQWMKENPYSSDELLAKRLTRKKNLK